jgi:NADPH2:quinone reductase
VLEYVDVPKPVPRDDEVLIDVAAAGVNLGDARERSGVYQRSETNLQEVALPRIPGVQVVGYVSEVGKSADSSLLGQKVMAFLPKGRYAHRPLEARQVMGVVVLDVSERP